MSSRAEAKAIAVEISSDGHGGRVPTSTPSRGFCSVRHGLALVLLLCNCIIYTQQMNLSIALPAMVNGTAPLRLPNASATGPRPDPQGGRDGALGGFKAVVPVYDWSPDIQGVLLGAFNYGSFLASMPSGYVAGLFKAKYLIGASVCISSVLNLFIPLAADAGVAMLTILRAAQGIAQVMVTTSQYSLWVKWATPLERNQLITISMSGTLLGSLTIFLVGGFLSETLGWPYIFYIFGGIGCVCSCLWFPLVSDDPEDHPFISSAERNYIVSSLAQQGRSSCGPLPIKSMIKSLPLWSILVSHFTIHWYMYCIIVYLPTYLHSELEVALSDTGFLTALLLGVSFVSTILGGLLADFLISRKILTLIVVRKLLTAIGVLCPSVLSVLLPWVSFSLGTSMAFLGLNFATTSLCRSGSLVNIMDIAPRYAGFLKGLTMVFAQLSGVISPTMSGFLLDQDPEFGWRNTFLVSAAVSISGLIVYLVLSRAEVQDWAREQTATRL